MKRIWQCSALSFLALAGSLNAVADPQFTGGITGIYQYTDEDQVDDEFTLSGDLVITLDAGGGQWLIYIEGSTQPDNDGISSVYPTANADAGSVLNRDGDGGVQISEFHYTFSTSSAHTFTFGLIDLSAWLDQSAIAADENTQFINGSLTQNATIEFPDYTIGGAYRRPGTDSKPEYTVVVAGSDGIADVPDRSYQNLLNLTSDERGVFVGASAVWNREQWTYGVGGWWRSDDHQVLGTVGEPMETIYGGFLNLDWSHEGHSVMTRIGSAKERVAIANRFLSIAYQRELPTGVLGIGISRTAVASTFRQRDLDDLTGAELYFRWNLGDGRGELTPSLQYVENPGFDGSGLATPSSATIATLRFHWAF
ncbi:MAG: hypothetical protein AAFN50_04535 [Pseudomonadota bacterium]